MNLTKSRYCTGLQCPKILWMDKNMPEQKAELDTSRMEIGIKIGEFARGYFGDYIEVENNRDNPNNARDMLTKTQELLKAGTEIIAEATFATGKNFCSVDILRKTDNGYELIEVKGSTDKLKEDEPDDKPADIKDIYFDDMAYQYYVVTNTGLTVSKVYIMQLSSKYVRQGELNVKELFSLVDCTDKILEMQDDIPGNINEITSIASKKNEPDIQIGSRCSKPYECAYKGWCFKDLPIYNVFDIGWNIRSAKIDKMFNDGVKSFMDVFFNLSTLKLNDKQELQVKTVYHNLGPTINKEEIRSFLNTLKYPVYHLDFETFQQAIPEWDGLSPYAQIPFQYSIHIQDRSGAIIEHKEYLAKEGTDPRREIAEKLCNDIPKDACVLAYNVGFEKSRILKLADHYIDLSEHLTAIANNLKDLADPFRNMHYYHRDMGGSYSIKKVLPAVLGYDPYANLEIVKGGGDAMTLFPILHTKPPEEIEKIREALLAYCKLDTQAMVWVLDKLYEMVDEY